MIRIGLISNPASRRNGRGLDRIEALIGEHPAIVHRTIESGGSAADLLADIAREDIEVLAINGGDGTVQRLLTALLTEAPFPSTPALALLAGGTTNLIAHDVGLRGAPEKGLRRLLELAANGRLEAAIRLRPVLRLDGLADAPAQCGMFLGLAALARAIVADRQRSPSRLPGSAALAAAVLRVLADRLRPAGRRAIVKGEPIRAAFDAGATSDGCRLLAFVTTLARLVFGSTPFWNQTGEPLRFTSVTCPPRRLVRSTWRVMVRGRAPEDLPEGGYESRSASRIELELAGPLALDGEIFAPRPGAPVVISSAGPLRFVTG